MATLTQMMPVGYRFVPTDEELIKYYLSKKVSYMPLPAGQVIQEIDASHFYSEPPSSLVGTDESEFFFFIRQDEYFHGKVRNIRTIGNGVGFWTCTEEEQPIYNSNGDILAFKIQFTYYSGTLQNAQKTHWRLKEYRLPTECQAKGHAEWILGRILGGTTTDFDDYSDDSS